VGGTHARAQACRPRLHATTSAIVTGGDRVLQGCIAHHWREDRLFVVMARGHVLPRRETLDFATVLDHPLVGAIEGGALSLDRGTIRGGVPAG
jgi:hypothetical protein